MDNILQPKSNEDFFKEVDYTIEQTKNGLRIDIHDATKMVSKESLSEKSFDVNKYRDIYKEICILTPDETLILVKESVDKEEQEFFELISNFLLRRKQHKIVKENLY